MNITDFKEATMKKNWREKEEMVAYTHQESYTSWIFMN